MLEDSQGLAMLRRLMPAPPATVSERLGGCSGGREQPDPGEFLLSFVQYEKNRSLCISLKEKNNIVRTPNTQ